MSARAAESIIEAGFPVTGSAQQKLAYAIRLTSTFSNVRNWQGCTYRLDKDCIELFANLGTRPDEIDPDGRESTICCGAALFRVKLALKRFGCLRLVELFPDLGNAELAARIHCGSGRGLDAQECKLFETMVGSPSSSCAPSEAPIFGTAFKALICTPANEPAWLEFPESEVSRKLLLAFTQAGKEKIPLSRKRRAEMQPTPQQEAQQLSFWGGDMGDSLQGLAVLKTKTDDKHGWLATGHAEARIQLQARVCRVPAYIFDRAFRQRCSRERLRTAIGRKGFVQAIVGFNLGTSDFEFSLLNELPMLPIQNQPPPRRWLHSLLGFGIKAYQQVQGKPLRQRTDYQDQSWTVQAR